MVANYIEFIPETGGSTLAGHVLPAAQLMLAAWQASNPAAQLISIETMAEVAPSVNSRTRYLGIRVWYQLEASPANVPKTLAAVVVNDRGDILPYTAHSTLDQCAEEASNFWGPEVWDKMQALGARVVQCEITLQRGIVGFKELTN